MSWNPRDVVGYDVGDMVKYLGCVDCQIYYGGHDDPRPYLEEGKLFPEKIVLKEEHTGRCETYISTEHLKHILEGW